MRIKSSRPHSPMPDTIALDKRLSYQTRGIIWAFLVEANDDDTTIAMSAFESGEFFSQSLDALLEDHFVRPKARAELAELRANIDEIELPIVIAHFEHNFWGGKPA